MLREVILQSVQTLFAELKQFDLFCSNGPEGLLEKSVKGAFPWRRKCKNWLVLKTFETKLKTKTKTKTKTKLKMKPS